MKDLSALTPPLLMAAIIIVVIIAFLRHEMARGRAGQRGDDRADPAAEAGDADAANAGAGDVGTAGTGTAGTGTAAGGGSGDRRGPQGTQTKTPASGQCGG